MNNRTKEAKADQFVSDPDRFYMKCGAQKAAKKARSPNVFLVKILGVWSMIPIAHDLKLYLSSSLSNQTHHEELRQEDITCLLI